jgi:hypothetical protein
LTTTETTRVAGRLRRYADDLRAVVPRHLARESADLLDEAAAALRELMSNSGPLSGAHRDEWLEANNRAGAVLARLNGGDAAMTAPTPAQTQREHDAEDLVTEEILDVAVEAIADPAGDYAQVFREELRTALRAVAPLIAARVELKLAAEPMRTAEARLVAAEREACAKIAEDYANRQSQNSAIAAAIRARGETE